MRGFFFPHRLWIQNCVPDICCCWELLHISPVLPGVSLLVNTPAVRTKWTRASEMSDLLKGEMSRHEHNLSVGSCAEREAYPTAAFWLMRKNRQTSQFSLSKHIWILWMTYGGWNNTNPGGCEWAWLRAGCFADRCHPRSLRLFSFPGRQIPMFCHAPQNLIQMREIPFSVCMRCTGLSASLIANPSVAILTTRS